EPADAPLQLPHQATQLGATAVLDFQRRDAEEAAIGNEWVGDEPGMHRAGLRRIVPALRDAAPLGDRLLSGGGQLRADGSGNRPIGDRREGAAVRLAKDDHAAIDAGDEGALQAEPCAREFGRRAGVGELLPKRLLEKRNAARTTRLYRLVGDGREFIAWADHDDALSRQIQPPVDREEANVSVRFDLRRPGGSRADIDIERTNPGLVFLQDRAEEDPQPLGGIGVEHDTVAQANLEFLRLAGIPGQVGAEEQRDLFPRARCVDDVGIGRLHCRVVPVHRRQHRTGRRSSPVVLAFFVRRLSLLVHGTLPCAIPTLLYHVDLYRLPPQNSNGFSLTATTSSRVLLISVTPATAAGSIRSR